MALGRIYEKGLSTKIDYEKAYFYYDMAAEKNDPYAIYWLGRACEVIINKFCKLYIQMGLHPKFSGSNMSFAYKFYKKAAEMDSKEAIFKLG